MRQLFLSHFHIHILMLHFSFSFNLCQINFFFHFPTLLVIFPSLLSNLLTLIVVFRLLVYSCFLSPFYFHSFPIYILIHSLPHISHLSLFLSPSPSLISYSSSSFSPTYCHSPFSSSFIRRYKQVMLFPCPASHLRVIPCETNIYSKEARRRPLIRAMNNYLTELGKV